MISTSTSDPGPAPETAKHHATAETDDEEPGSESEVEEPPRPLADLYTQLILHFAGYDMSKLQDGDALDDEALKILRDKNTHKRTIFRSWPRDPNGKYITPDNSCEGKTTSNGLQLWGATLADFYRVRRIPGIPGLVTISTGSKLAAWMKKHGELEFAADEIACAEREAEPKEVLPFDIAEIVPSIDMRIGMGLIGKSLLEDSKKENKGTVSVEQLKRLSVFDPASYPAPWPTAPFSYDPPRLQARLPLRFLPKTLIVHDPWNLLAVDDDDSWSIDSKGEHGCWTTEQWPKMTYTTRKYHLALSSVGLSRLNEKKDPVDKTKESSEGFILTNSKTSDGPVEAPIFVHLPPRPAPESEPVAEAHLYLSPEFAAGKGNHSMVYFAEWEVPRSMVMPPTLCRSCVLEDVEKILTEEDGEDGSRTAPQWKEKKSYVKRVKHILDPITFKTVSEEELEGSIKGKNKSGDGTKRVYAAGEEEAFYSIKLEGPIRDIHTRVQWRSADDPCDSHCNHSFGAHRNHPRTARVRVTAKLSLWGDHHLEREAGNYQSFPDHFFEHWNGYNITPPLHDPTPVGAVVPQFYGMYKPEDDGSNNRFRGKPSSYLSPILLLEDCGTPVDPKLLAIDDKNECASLYYRFHEGGWGHGSIAKRNIVMAPGPISESPLFRAARRLTRTADDNSGLGDLAFRLIDFGRSVPDEHGEIALCERSEVSRLIYDSRFGSIF